MQAILLLVACHNLGVLPTVLVNGNQAVGDFFNGESVEKLREMLYQHLPQLYARVVCHSFGVGESEKSFEEMARIFGISAKELRAIRDVALMALLENPKTMNKILVHYQH